MSPNRKRTHEAIRTDASTGHISDQDLYAEVCTAIQAARMLMWREEDFASAATELALASDLAKVMARRLEAQGAA